MCSYKYNRDENGKMDEVLTEETSISTTKEKKTMFFQIEASNLNQGVFFLREIQQNIHQRTFDI